MVDGLLSLHTSSDDFLIKGWTSDDCATEIDECLSSPCHTPGGACINDDNAYRCECDPGYTGK